MSLIDSFNRSWGGGCIPLLHYTSLSSSTLVRGFDSSTNMDTISNHADSIALLKVRKNLSYMYYDIIKVIINSNFIHLE